MQPDALQKIARAVRRALLPLIDEREAAQHARFRADLAAIEHRLSAAILGVSITPGPPGPPGTLPVVAAWTAGQTHAPGAWSTHRGTLWQARARTDEEPGEAAAWLPVVDGVSGVAVDAGELAVSLGSGLRLQLGTVRGEPGPGLVWRGRFKPETAYTPGDLVMESGSTWICRNPEGAGQTPGQSPAWELFAGRGRRGARGETGEPAK